MTCPHCHEELVVGSWPFCRGGHAPASVTVIGDEIDVVQEHFGPTPERFRSRQRMKQRMRELGLMPYVRHVGERGSDKSTKTQRWV
jgi:hypothetical protein